MAVKSKDYTSTIICNQYFFSIKLHCLLILLLLHKKEGYTRSLQQKQISFAPSLYLYNK
jgi:hypothetical protein